jgi:hypothetical protein
MCTRTLSSARRRQVRYHLRLVYHWYTDGNADNRQHDSQQKESRVISTENDPYDMGMDVCVGDKVRVTVAKSESIGSKSAAESINAAPVLQLQGCSLISVNGRYIEAGQSSGCMRFRNVKGWVIFRQSLKELPELGIYADSCYDAFGGPSQRGLLDRRSGEFFIAFEPDMLLMYFFLLHRCGG